MEGLGLLVVAAFVILTLAIVTTSCSDWKGVEGFSTTNTVSAQPVPKPVKLIPQQDVTGYSSITDLPSAPVVGLAETNTLPYQDPAMQKASLKMINELKQDMDGFSKFELPFLQSRSDPAVKLPLTRFQGDYQRMKDEVLVLQRTPGLQSQLAIDDVNAAAANLRFLQRTYRVYSGSGMVPVPKADLTKVGAVTEGFADGEGFADASGSEPITPDEMKVLSQKLAIEIARLQASGSTDPVLKARVNLFSRIRQTVDDLNTRIKNGSLVAKDIPIKRSDYEKFLPALGTTSAGIGGLITKSGGGSLSSLFNSYDVGDASGADIAAALLDKYAMDIVRGLSISVSYTSPNELAKAQALATAAQIQPSGKQQRRAPAKKDVRGEFDSVIQQLGADGFTSAFDQGGELGEQGECEEPGKPGHFDWKERADQIAQSIKRYGMDPADFGCLPAGAVVSKDFSWRGHAKMVCNRLSTVADPGIPEQMGCPPVSWKGWRL
jgi:hypothetical protein